MGPNQMSSVLVRRGRPDTNPGGHVTVEAGMDGTGRNWTTPSPVLLWRGKTQKNPARAGPEELGR